MAENTNPDNAAKTAVRLAGSSKWRLFMLPDGGYAGGQVSEWEAAMKEYEE